MPHEHMFVVAQLILDVATPDINKADEIRTTLKDIWDIRQSKLRFVENVDWMFKVWMIRLFMSAKLVLFFWAFVQMCLIIINNLQFDCEINHINTLLLSFLCQ